ncbi:MAG: hypothetical protein FJ004_02890 [Chloroflexi bacterium]|nr:hypothetical protein [Chloroflexota bacterium]
MERRLKLQDNLSKKEEPAVEVSDFWAGKSPCWEMCHCPPVIKVDCPANKFTSLPCWEIEGTYCKLQQKGAVLSGTDTSICESCRVHKKYGASRPIELKLFGRGIDKSITKKG